MLGLVLSLFVALLMPEAVYFLSAGGSFAGYTFEAFLKGFINNLTIGFFVGSVIPIAQLGASAAHKIGIKNENGLPFHLVRTFVIAAVMVFFLSLILMFLELGFMAGFFAIWCKMAPVILLIVYVYLLFVLPLSVKICMGLCTKD